MNPLLLLPMLPGVTPEMLLPDFWLEKMPDPDQVLLNPTQINAFNQSVYSKIDIPPVLDLPDFVSAAQVKGWIRRYKIPGRPRYGGGGQLLDVNYFTRLIRNASPDLSDQVPVRFGLVTRRTAVRAFPTSDIAMEMPHDFPTDFFQETALDVGWAVAGLATSRDEKWVFCLTPLYWGWVSVADIGFATREIVQDYVEAEKRVVTIWTQGLVGLASGGGVTPQMGTSLPLLDQGEDFFRVRVPTNAPQNSLKLADGFISKTFPHFSDGFLPLTVRNLFNAAFSLLGDPYAWGCSRLGIFGRDCSRLVKDVYGISGVIMPRNGDEQAKIGQTRANFTPEMSEDERKKLVVECAVPGDILATPGHVMLYLGNIDGEPYAIHAKGGKFKAVLVSTLMLDEDTPRGSILRNLTSVVSLR